MHFLPARQRVHERSLAFLSRALDLAEQAAPFASPNPTVGCFLVRDDVVLGEGAHVYDARDHAEIVALKAAAAAGQDVRDATAYVTLEPCSHHGRTGPCADALVAAGIGRCLVATVDPNPLVRGQGIAKLRAAGVIVDLLDPATAEAQRARRLNDAFAFSVQHGRPFVTLKAAVSRNGKLAPNPAQRTSTAPFWLTGPAARSDVQHLRHRADALLTGIGTVLADNPTLTDRTGLPRRRHLLRVVLDSQLRTPPASALVQTAREDLLLLTSLHAPRDREDLLRARGADIARLPSSDGALDLHAVMATLAARAVRSLLVEAGSVLNGSLLRQNLVDQLVLYRAPTELRPDALPFAHDVSLPDLMNTLSHRSEASFSHGQAQDLRLTGYLHDPWAEIEPLV